MYRPLGAELSLNDIHGQETALWMVWVSHFFRELLSPIFLDILNKSRNFALNARVYSLAKA